jgi:hypothetical protein
MKCGPASRASRRTSTPANCIRGEENMLRRSSKEQKPSSKEAATPNIQPTLSPHRFLIVDLTVQFTCCGRR